MLNSKDEKPGVPRVCREDKQTLAMASTAGVRQNRRADTDPHWVTEGLDFFFFSRTPLGLSVGSHVLLLKT